MFQSDPDRSIWQMRGNHEIPAQNLSATIVCRRVPVQIITGSKVIGIHETGAGSGTTATGHVHRSRIPTGWNRTGSAAAISKGTGTRRADTTITTTAGIAIASATGIASGGSTETTTIAIAGSVTCRSFARSLYHDPSFLGARLSNRNTLLVGRLRRQNGNDFEDVRAVARLLE
jgi:hypothetical protein